MNRRSKLGNEILGKSLHLKNGMQILPLMATTIEYGTHLKARVDPYIVGVGPVEAAMNTARVMQQCEKAPDYALLLGSSGSASLQQGEIYQAKSVSYRDMDASAIGFEKGLTPFVDLPAALELAPQFDFIPKATLSTGGKVIVGDEFEQLSAEMVDMETFAVKRVCQSFDVPLIALRGISDGKKELQQFNDWTELLPLLDEKLAKLVDGIIEALETS
ncbi:5'-methylthioadenosine/S-adenosylhomocysteine nucleosidase [Maritalea myrionectae]|uniref:5'-methylthioadenosine/S-adenosylhomocysteine nucleosidase n=1 Tax=Maritalea myrionectae TaxID=454601 RepID=UPI0009FF8805